MKGKLIVANWNNSDLLVATLNDERKAITSVETLLDHNTGILGMDIDNENHIYFSDQTGIFTVQK